MNNWNKGSAKTECAEKSWLYNRTYTQWTVTPSSSNSYGVFIIFTSGYVTDSSNLAAPFSAMPVLYLKSNVKVKSGDGSVSNPYELTM